MPAVLGIQTKFCLQVFGLMGLCLHWGRATASPHAVRGSQKPTARLYVPPSSGWDHPPISSSKAWELLWV